MKRLLAGVIATAMAVAVYATAFGGTVGNPPGTGFALQDGAWLTGLAGGANQVFSNTLVAHAGGGQTNALILPSNTAMIGIATVATTGDSVALPICVAPLQITVTNNGANAMNLFANPNTNTVTNSTDTINGNSNTTSYSIPVNGNLDAYCLKNGAWSVAFNSISSGSLTIANGKTLTVNNTLTFAGTDGTTFTFPSITDNVVTTSAVQTLGNKTMATLQVTSQLFSTFGLPTIGSGACAAGANGTIAAGSTNASGQVNIGATATTNCQIGFSVTLAQAPNACVLFPQNAAAATTGTTVARVAAVTTSGFVISGSALANANYWYICL